MGKGKYSHKKGGITPDNESAPQKDAQVFAGENQENTPPSSPGVTAENTESAASAGTGIGERIAAAFRGGDKLRGSSRRIWELDFIRGVCVLLMVFDHFIYDIGYIFSPAWIRANPDMEWLEYIRDAAREYWNSSFHTDSQHVVVWIFCFVCGISCYFSRSNLKRGIMAAVFAMLITLVTSQLGMTIRFGILHMFAFAILLRWLIDTVCRHKKLRTAVVSLVLGIDRQDVVLRRRLAERGRIFVRLLPYLPERGLCAHRLVLRLSSLQQTTLPLPAPGQVLVARAVRLLGQNRALGLCAPPGGRGGNIGVNKYTHLHPRGFCNSISGNR